MSKTKVPHLIWGRCVIFKCYFFIPKWHVNIINSSKSGKKFLCIIEDSLKILFLTIFSGETI